MATRTNRTYGADRRGTAQTRPSNAYNAYIYGNAAPRLDPDVRRRLEQPVRRPLSNTARKNREKAKHMSLGYVMFLMAALGMVGMILINYIKLQADITTLAEQVSASEAELNNLRIANEEEYSRINSSIDFEQIKRIAIGELGMIYPEEGQIILYDNEGYDYVRKVTQE